MPDQDHLRRLSSHLEEALQEASSQQCSVLHQLLEMATQEVCGLLLQASSQRKAA
jgi:hypothetical protein